MTTCKKQKGLSLIELLVALALSASLSTAIYQIVLSNRVNIELVESHSKVQESARIALSMMARDLRMAGYTGCINNIANITSAIDKNGNGYIADWHEYDGTKPFIWAEDNYSSGGGTIGGQTPVIGSDVFYSRSATSSDMYVKNGFSASDESFEISGKTSDVNIATKAGNVLMVTNCETAHVFSVSETTTNGEAVHKVSVTGGADNTASGLGQGYKPGSQVLLMNSFAYFIAPSTVVMDKKGDPVNALYKYSQLGGTDALELVPYVEDLQFTYGVDTNGDMSVNEYKTANDIASGDFSSKVKSIQFELVIAGDTNVDANTSDGFLRKTYNKVVQIRNSNLGAGVAAAAP